jgi:hypothetical protein
MDIHEFHFLKRDNKKFVTAVKLVKPLQPLNCHVVTLQIPQSYLPWFAASDLMAASVKISRADDDGIHPQEGWLSDAQTEPPDTFMVVSRAQCLLL